MVSHVHVHVDTCMCGDMGCIALTVDTRTLTHARSISTHVCSLVSHVLCHVTTVVFHAVDTAPLSSGSPGNRTCVLCPPGTWADQSGFTCVECGVDNCSLCEDAGLCFPSSLLPLPTLPSTPPPFTYYLQHFTTAVGLCRYGNQEACQLLVNLCVLQRYSRLKDCNIHVFVQWNHCVHCSLNMHRKYSHIGVVNPHVSKFHPHCVVHVYMYM